MFKTFVCLKFNISLHYILVEIFIVLLWDHLSGQVTFTRCCCKYGQALSFTLCIFCTFIISCSLGSKEIIYCVSLTIFQLLAMKTCINGGSDWIKKTTNFKFFCACSSRLRIGFKPIKTKVIFPSTSAVKLLLSFFQGGGRDWGDIHFCFHLWMQV